MASFSRRKPVWFVKDTWDAGSPQARQLWPLSVTGTKYAGAYRWELRNPPYLAVELLLEGELSADIDGARFELTPGDLLMICRPNFAVLNSRRGFRKRALLLQGTLLDAVLSGFSLYGSRLIRPGDPEAVEKLIVSIGSALGRKTPEAVNDVNGRVFELISTLAAEGARNSAYPDSLNRAIRIIETRPEENLPLTELASAAGCSVSTLQREFRRCCGTTASGYRQKTRLRLARQLLGGSELSIKEIAGRTGYFDQAHFSRDFKRCCGVSPRAWRCGRVSTASADGSWGS